MAEQWRQIRVRESTRLMIINQVRQEFLKHHPEFERMHLSYDFLIHKAILFYLEAEV